MRRRERGRKGKKLKKTGKNRIRRNNLVNGRKCERDGITE